MRVFIAALATETNTFSPIPTGRQNFEETFLAYGDATQREPMFFSAPLHVWRKRAEERGWEVIESLAAVAQPAGITVGTVYEEFRNKILTDLENAAPVDIVLLSLHGAMVAEGYPDCEGDLLTRARSIVGVEATIAAELDPHAHLTDNMQSAADLLVFFKEFPHTDIDERAEDLFRLASDTAEQLIKPVMRAADCRMMSIYHTPNSPMRSYVDAMLECESGEPVLSLSLIHGFPWGDHVNAGSQVLCITDGDADGASSVAEEFARRLWNIRDDLRIDYPGIEAALDIADAEKSGPVVLADVADNAGGGAPSDSTFILKAVLDRGYRDVALGIFWDPLAVRMCRAAGEGAQLKLRVGGKVGPASGDPVDLDVVIHKIAEGLSQRIGNSSNALGTLVWIEADGVHLLINDLRTQVFHPEAFTSIGIDLQAMRVIVVKSTQHFYAGFAPLASKIVYVAAPGALNMNFAEIPYIERERNFWPVVDDPFSCDNSGSGTIE